MVLAQDRQTLLSVLAVAATGAVDLTHEKGSRGDRRWQSIADTLSQALQLDMRDFWRANADYRTRLPKAELLNARADAPTVLKLPAAKREALLKGARQAEEGRPRRQGREAFESVGYLPDLLVTEPPMGGLTLTDSAQKAVAA